MDERPDPIRAAFEYGRDIFSIFEEFFMRATGVSATEFASIETFSNAIRANAARLSSRGQAAYPWLEGELRPFYARRGATAFEDAKHLGGMSLVLGGSSHFLRSQFTAVSMALLYSDTVLIPDPVMPWFESERTEERFRHVKLLQAVHSILHLKPIVDADLPYPPIVIFPSWEKTLEEHDDVTKQGIFQLVADIISGAFSEKFETIEEVMVFVDRKPDLFFEGVDRERLLIAPGGSLDEPLGDALVRYESEIMKWRSRDWADAYKALPVQRKILNGLFERIGPMYHLFENAIELRASPLTCLEQHAHYFNIVSRTGGARLENAHILNPETTALMGALNSRRLSWLGSISIEGIVELRVENEHTVFRKLLGDSVGRLQRSEFENIDRVTSEVCHEIASAILKHEKELRLVQDKYSRKHAATALVATMTLAAVIAPVLTPLLGSVLPLAAAGKYGIDKVSELAEKRRLTHSLVGFLAQAKSKEQPVDGS